MYAKLTIIIKYILFILYFIDKNDDYLNNYA